jgi:hypothetical protein
MISLRYLILSGIYVICHFISEFYRYRIEIPLHPILLCLSTFIFFAIIKYDENYNCTHIQHKLPINYIIKQSLFFAIIAFGSQYLYQFFLEKECIDSIANIFHSIDSFTYIPESLFIAGIVLLTNHLSIVIYPKCL